jgi:hypothetical protein
MCSSDTFSTTKITWTAPGLNAGLRGERPATNRRNHGGLRRSTSGEQAVGGSKHKALKSVRFERGVKPTPVK